MYTAVLLMQFYDRSTSVYVFSRNKMYILYDIYATNADHFYKPQQHGFSGGMCLQIVGDWFSKQQLYIPKLE